MKLTLTVTEVTTLVRKSLGLPLDTEIVISPDAEMFLAEPIRDLVDTIDNLDWDGVDKLQCIKTFRSAHQTITCNQTVTSLASAKLAVENWPVTRKWIVENKKLPTKFGDNQYNFNLGD